MPSVSKPLSHTMDRDGGRRAPSLPSPISALTDDLLQDILLRLPPHPFHLASASCVCKDWRRVVSDNVFLDRVRRHHRTPAVVGFFGNHPDRHFLTPNSVGGLERFAAQIPSGDWWAYGCRHGRVLLHHRFRGELLVSDLITRQNHYLSTPPRYMSWWDSLGTVLCADDHEHGDCHARPFLVAFLFANRARSTMCACVYSSETDEWGAISSISSTFAYIDMDTKHTAWVGNTIYWLVSIFSILKYDLDTHTLDVVAETPSIVSIRSEDGIVLLPADDGGLGIVGVEGFHLNFWSRKRNNDGVLVWTVYRSIDLKQFLKPRHLMRLSRNYITPKTIAVAEDAEVIFILLEYSVYSLHLRSMQFKKVFRRGYQFSRMIHPYSAFYTAGVDAGAEDGPANLAGAVNIICLCRRVSYTLLCGFKRNDVLMQSCKFFSPVFVDVVFGT